ncbi:tRNA 5-methylaminomethyl-2-thiouridine biosynthesis bifunctional protein MnmC [Vibrio stylophorae]|uniref:tRNA 5-methylaminomethyl-2-thiouridine biosynthesis bifunctional protein MnmC n=1 Tax=Vibrio stylophorae TaxID=659351 RepID=A0ABM8ZUS0_9VIBR|nr:bifunctional tRNA (5-methylaminomethyl-2-thiouridine)(34)-methyltransferase MnmD/FAD-dependent 5-carboxymethylaminomethyl-2-thiouridine(34) oxidoreductase MnmC [Vibrio stylophorae]CAH0534068.1 tRNA 5-methylaminomethyl-2-thiouridine biosynthesis bifunctional protein MnmC [Vibrio stylophorae]
MSQTRLTSANISWNDAGTPVSHQFDDVYFSNDNGLEETRYVFLNQNQIPERWLTHTNRRFVIAETGFGTGLNFLAAWQAFDQFREANPTATLNQLHFVTFEKFPIALSDLKKAHAQWPELASWAEQLQSQYPHLISGCHRLIFAGGAITLDLWFGDIHQTLPEVVSGEHGIVDAWFLDGFAPSKNPEMWTEALFQGLARLSKNQGTLATFTAAGFVRRGLIEAGFEMHKVKGFGHKREMIAGARRPRAQSEATPYASPSAHQKDPQQSIAIIGGGIAAACIAHQLLQRGDRVTIYCEDKQAGLGASGNRQGALYPLLNGQHDELSQIYAQAFGFARRQYDQLAQHLDFAHDWCGVLHLGFDEKQQQKNEQIAAGPFSSELITPLSAEQSNQTAGLALDQPGLFYPQGGWLCPQQLCQALFAAIDAHAFGEICYQTHVETIASHPNGWQLKGQYGHDQTLDVRHELVILANGYQVTQFAQTQAMPLYPVRGQVTHAPSNAQIAPLRTVLCADGYFTPQDPKHHTHCLGASYGRNQTDLAIRSNEQQENKAKLCASLPHCTALNAIDSDHLDARVGVRCASRDHLPALGIVANYQQNIDDYQAASDMQDGQKIHLEQVPLAYYDNLFVLGGLGARGLCSAPLLAESLASQIHGEPIPLSASQLKALHPARFWLRRLQKGKALPQTADAQKLK